MPSASPLVGSHYSRQTICRVSTALVQVWETSNRDAHRTDSPADLNERFEALRQGPLMQFCRDARDEGGQPLNAAHDGTARMLKLIRRRDSLSKLPAAYCATVTQLARDIEAVRQIAKVETNVALRAQYDLGFRVLKRHLANLLETGFLSELPLGRKLITVDPLTLERLAAVLYERWHVLLRAAEAPNFERWICRNLGMSLGLGLFDPVRAQEWGRAEMGIEGLARFLDRPHPRFRRQLVPNIAFSLDQVMRIAYDLREASFKAPAGSSLRENRFKAALVPWITTVNVLRTGVLESLSQQN